MVHYDGLRYLKALWLNEKAQLGYQVYVLNRAYWTLISACIACSGPYLNDGVSPARGEYGTQYYRDMV